MKLLSVVGALSVACTAYTSGFYPVTSTRESAAAHPVSEGAAASPCYTITDLGTLGGNASKAYGVNDSGHVVGESDMPGSMYRHAFIYRNGAMQDLGTLGGPSSTAYDINDSDEVVGVATLSSGLPRAFRFRNEMMQDLGSLTTNGASYAYGINDDGHAAGVAQTSSGVNHAFRYQGGALQDLGVLPTIGSASGGWDINLSAHVVGYADIKFGSLVTSHGFFHDGVMLDVGTLSGRQDSYSEALAINDGGQVVGWSEVVSGTNVYVHAFLYENGDMQDLGTLGQPHSMAFGINNTGQVVGRIYGSGVNHAFLYQSGVMQDLNDLLPADSGWELVEARDISDAGDIVGWGGVSGFGYTHAFLMRPCAATNTGTGSDVEVPSGAGDARVVFSQVSIAGNTTFTAIDPNAAGTPPEGFTLCPTCPAYDIATTAAYTPPVTVCLDVPASVDAQTFAALRLLHGESGVLVDVTTVRITNTDGTREVCGQVSTLSPFVLGSPMPTTSTTTIPGATTTTTAGRITTTTAGVTTTIPVGGKCSQPVTDGSNPLASDCLFILRAAVGVLTCSPACICNVNGGAGITATDALSCLRKVVGQDVELACPCP